MYSKLTLFGKQNSGKTTILKYLTYLLWQHKANSIVSVTIKAKGHSKYAYYPTLTQQLFNTLFSKPDFNISFCINHPQNNKTYSVCICTGGDTCDRVISNWKFAAYKQCRNQNTLEILDEGEADIFISACRAKEEVIDTEQLKQREKLAYKKEEAVLLYWFKTNTKEKFDDVVRQTEIDEPLFEDATNTIFKPNKNNTPMRDYAQYATLIEQKIENLSKLL